MVLDIVTLTLLLFLSAFFSSSELAFVVSNKIKIELKARKNKLAAKNALHYIKNPSDFFSTILISNNIVNIAFASIFTVFITARYHLSELTILSLSSITLLVFGELLPKYFARELPNRFIMITINPIRLVTFIIYPFVKITSHISETLTKSASVNEETVNYLYERGDINKLVEESTKVGNVEREESDIVKRVMELGDQKVYEAMTPRIDIVGVDINSEISDVIEAFITSGYSKLPVYEENIDKIKGLVFVNDMYKSPKNLRDIVRDVIFVPDTKKSLDMLNEMLEKHISVSIVVDEFGGTAGIITVEDILEELFGEIRDEYDIDDEICKEIEPDTYVISGKVETDRINNLFDLEIPEGDYETLGGYITTKLGRIPKGGEKFEIEHFNFLILRSDKVKVDLLKVNLNKEKWLDYKAELEK